MELAESGSFVAPMSRIPRCFIRATNNGFTTILVVMAWFYIDVIGMLAELIFFTVTLRNRSSDLLVRHVDLLRVAFRNVRTDRPFTIDAIVILPDHLHTIWTLPDGDTDYSGRWRAIKSHFTHTLRATGISLNQDNRGEYQLWQRRFWEHTIRDERDYAHHVDYCHWNPIKHGLVQHLSDWPHSSFHRYVRLGLLPPDWSGMIAEPKADYGELIM